jgi:hypothetical protein
MVFLPVGVFRLQTSLKKQPIHFGVTLSYNPAGCKTQPPFDAGPGCGLMPEAFIKAFSS